MEFKITEIRREPSSGGVVEVRWWAGLSDGALNGVLDGVVNFVPNPADQNFIPFDDLDESTVIGWVKQALGKEFDSIQPALQAQIDRQKAPALVSGLPWV
jgi:hypothetical protein